MFREAGAWGTSLKPNPNRRLVVAVMIGKLKTSGNVTSLNCSTQARFDATPSLVAVNESHEFSEKNLSAHYPGRSGHITMIDNDSCFLKQNG